VVRQPPELRDALRRLAMEIAELAVRGEPSAERSAAG
jgi:hypothetical protein